MSEILEKGQLSLEKATKLFESKKLKEAYCEILKCLNHLPHKDVFTRAIYSSSVVLRREKIEARTNELLGKIYAENAKRDEFPMKNANNKEQMKKYAIQLFLVSFLGEWWGCIVPISSPEFPGSRSLPQILRENATIEKNTGNYVLILCLVSLILVFGSAGGGCATRLRIWSVCIVRELHGCDKCTMQKSDRVHIFSNFQDPQIC